MKAKNNALINYYARLIRKDQWKMEDVPEHLRESVKVAIKALEAVETDTAEESISK